MSNEPCNTTLSIITYPNTNGNKSSTDIQMNALHEDELTRYKELATTLKSATEIVNNRIKQLSITTVEEDY